MTYINPNDAMVEAIARAIHGKLSNIDVMKYLDMPDDTAERCAEAAAAVIADTLAERDAEIARLTELAKNNNELAKMYRAQANEFRAKYVAATGEPS